MLALVFELIRYGIAVYPHIIVCNSTVASSSYLISLIEKDVFWVQSVLALLLTLASAIISPSTIGFNIKAHCSILDNPCKIVADWKRDSLSNMNESILNRFHSNVNNLTNHHEYSSHTIGQTLFEHLWQLWFAIWKSIVYSILKISYHSNRRRLCNNQKSHSDRLHCSTGFILSLNWSKAI